MSTTMDRRFAVSTHTASEANFGVNSYLVTGERDAFLVDAQFALAEAETVADLVASSGKRLRFVVISHGHPDHFLGLPAITARFPDAQVLATPAVIEQIRVAGPATLDLWRPALGDALARDVVLPQPLTTHSLLFEGEPVQVVELPAGESEAAVALLLPATGDLFAGDAVYSHVHSWLLENRPDGALAGIAALKALPGVRTVYPGHGPAAGPEVFDANEQYIRDFVEASASSATPQEAAARMLERYPNHYAPMLLDWSTRAVMADATLPELVQQLLTGAAHPSPSER